MDFKRITSCRICKSTKLTRYLDLGSTPLANKLLSSKDEKYEEYPLEVLFCEECSLSQLSIVVDPSVLYTNYPYHSSISKTFQKHCRDMAIQIKAILDANRPWNYSADSAPYKGTLDSFAPLDHHVLDIASNDGCLLSEFHGVGFGVMGVEPSKNLADIAESRGITTLNAFWGSAEAECVPVCDVITATNVLAHVDDVRDFILQAKRKLKSLKKGIMVVEVPYLMNLIKQNQFDTIYHEHLSYFLVKPLRILFESCGMRVFRVEEHDVHGGSIRIYASPYFYRTDESVARFEKREESEGFHKIERYQKFSEEVNQLRENLLMLMEYARENGKTVVGYGASAKGISLINFCGMTERDISCIVDDTPAKQGKWVAKAGIEIVTRKGFEYCIRPDYIFILSWNFAKEMMENTEIYRQRGSKYIIPIPRVRIL
jgi:SAM-dependent methyltransferase